MGWIGQGMARALTACRPGRILGGCVGAPDEMTDVRASETRSGPQPPTGLSFSSADIDDTRSVLSRFYYPLAVRLPAGAEGFAFHAEVIQLGPLTVGRLGFGAPVTLIAPELDGYHVTIPTAGRVRTR